MPEYLEARHGFAGARRASGGMGRHVGAPHDGRSPGLRERRRGRRGSLAGLLAAWAALSPVVAAGHAIVLESAPVHDAVLARAPERVFLRFNSRIERDFTRVTLTAGDGRPVALPVHGAGLAAGPDRVVIPLRPLPGGTYVLRYRVLAADGHVTEGALRFTVREAP